MESKFVLDLEEWIKAKGLKKSDANVAAFIAVRDHVKARLDQGYSAAIIHEYLRDAQQIDFCYDTFLKYVHRYVQPPRRGQKARRGQPGRAPSANKGPETNAGAAPNDTSEIPSFIFNPIANRDDLL